MKLEGKVALVTGAGGGLGQGIALAYAREGARVVVNDISQAGIDDTVGRIAVLGGEALGVRADVSSSREVAAMYAEIVERWGTLDILVNNAARLDTSDEGLRARVAYYRQKLEPGPVASLGRTRNISDDEWRKFIDVDLTGVFYCTREALRIMEDRGYGKIINIASIAGFTSSSAFASHYSAAKGGVIAFTHAVAAEVIGAGVIVNCIAPGGVATLPWEQAPQAARDTVLRLIPARRLGAIEEYAALAVFLAGDDCNYLVGQVISPNGGVLP